MRKVCLFLIIILTIQQSMAQDKVVKLTGETVSCKVVEITNDAIKYTLDTEDVLRNIPKEKVEQIVFESGNIEKINNRVTVNSEADWRKVQIVNLSSDVEGYQKGEKLNASVNSGWSRSNLKKTEIIAMKNLKKVAAANGYHIVYLTDSSVKSGVVVDKKRRRIKASITGFGYAYK